MTIFDDEVVDLNHRFEWFSAVPPVVVLGSDCSVLPVTRN